MTPTVRLAALAAGALALLAGPVRAHPVVAGFERFHGGPEADPAAGGRLLLSELNCASCHAAGQPKKQAPVLDGIGTRARVGYLRKYIADPHAVKPGTTMPALFAGDADRDAKVEALVHFLATTGTPAQSRPDFKAVLRGRDTYAKVGCAACHGPRDVSGEPARNQFGFAVPLGNLKDKYTVPGLSAFLANPLHSRPAGRMPHLLKPGEALDVAQYLLQGVRVTLPNGKGTTAYAYYEGGWDRLPNFEKEKPVARGTGIAFEIGMAKRRGDFAFRFEGYFRTEAAGEYRFYLSSDDGSRLLIDGRKVADNDGIHATETKAGAIELTKGVHQIVVEYFQGNGEVSLEVEIEGRGLGRQPLAPHVAATEADLDRKVEPKAVPDEDALTVRPELVEKGRAVFASAGCASCHQMSVNKAPVAATNKAAALAELKAAGGCLADAPRPGLPRYELNGAQRQALTAAIARPHAASTEPQAVVHRTMVTFNCYACHERKNVGGPTPATNALFATTTPEMGDEGRVPPPLDGVGAKLNPAYLKHVLDKGADDRPYMHTRMPGFGPATVGHLTAAFEALDKLPAVPPVTFAASELKVVSAGRYMVGAQAFGCNKCHTFAGNRAEGVQGIDMLLMPKRLKRDWFHAYCIDPQKIRPGTRMPTAWPMGQSTLPSVLNGEAATQVEAIWAYLNSKNPQVPAGMGRKFLPIVPYGEAVIYRNFIQGAGTRAIGVGYPEKLNLAFDANDLRLAMAWKGGFIDAARHWTDRGAGFEGPLGDEVLAFPTGPDFSVLSKADAPWPTKATRDAGLKFLGYSTTKDERPTFRYAVGGVTVEDFPNPSGKDNPVLRRTFTFFADAPVEGLYFRAAVGSKVERAGDGWYKVDGYRVRVEGQEPIVRPSAGRSELLVPIRLADRRAKLVQELSW